MNFNYENYFIQFAMILNLVYLLLLQKAFCCLSYVHYDYFSEYVT